MSLEMPSRSRIAAIDMLRGTVMVLMVLDHARDFYFGMNGPRPTDVAATTPVLFFTRWITHYCAPVFVFLAGTAAYLYGARRTPSERSRFLLTRGIFLVLLEVTVIRMCWVPDPFYRFTLLQVIWAIGWAMVILAAASRLPLRAVAVIGLVIVAGHNLLDGVSSDRLGAFGWVWTLLHERKMLEPIANHRLLVSYSILPWFGVMALGFAFGPSMQLPDAERRKRTLRMGLALTAAFILIRAVNVYGDPSPWTVQESPLFTLLSFLNCEKYPPSLLFLLMTLGPALCVLSLFDGMERPLRPLVLIGGVPLFFYIAHLALLRYTSGPIAFARFGFSAFQPPPGHAGSPELPLWCTYLVWIATVLLLYPACRWFAALKARRPGGWLSYF